MVHFVATLATSVLLIIASEACADFTGQVVGVMDGDTIELLHDKKTECIRLHGIDCPEKGQPFGKPTFR